MRRAVLLVLAGLTLAGGCAGPHARKSVAEFRPGGKPSASRVPYGAAYTLIHTDRPNDPLVRVDLARNEVLGFRQEPDLSVVAVAGSRVFPLADGTFVWVMVPGTEPGWRERTAEDVRQVWKATVNAVLAVVTIPLFILTMSPGARFA